MSEEKQMQAPTSFTNSEVIIGVILTIREAMTDSGIDPELWPNKALARLVVDLRESIKKGVWCGTLV